MAGRDKHVSYRDATVRPVTLTSLDDGSNQASVTASNNAANSTAGDEDRLVAILAEAASPRNSNTFSRLGTESASDVNSPHQSMTSSTVPPINDTSHSLAEES